jgi:CHASE3 domain sensor protein
MTNAQLYFAIGLPCFTIVTSLIVSLVQVWGVRDSIKEVREEIRDIREDIREIRSDLKILTGKVYELMGEKH